MLSPITGKEMTIKKELRKMNYRNEEFDVLLHSWLCSDTGEMFEDEEFAELNYRQVIDQYKEKQNIFLEVHDCHYN